MNKQPKKKPLKPSLRGLVNFFVLIVGLAFFFAAQIFYCENSSVYAYGSKRDWEYEKSTHFIVYYDNADREFIAEVIDKAEGYYSSIAEDLGFNRYDFWLWDNRAQIYIYNDAQDYQRSTGKPAWSGGVAYYHGKVIESFPWAQGFLDSLLPHELTHIIFREFIGPRSNAPTWLDEGVAMYNEKIKRSNIKRILYKALEERRLIPLDELSTLNIMFVKDKETVELFYAESFSVVEFLLTAYGKHNFGKFCRALRDRKTFDNALNEGYRMFKDINDLNKAWIRYLKD